MPQHLNLLDSLNSAMTYCQSNNAHQSPRPSCTSVKKLDPEMIEITKNDNVSATCEIKQEKTKRQNRARVQRFIDRSAE